MIAVAVVLAMFGFGVYSQSGSPPGLVNGQLKPCPSAPHCVVSEQGADSAHAVVPIQIHDKMGEEPLLFVQEVLADMGADVVATEDNYLAVTFTSAVFGFVDDVEIRLDTANKVLQIRSSSRVGYADFGTNRNRVEAIRTALSKAS
ncbi:DUF1499 domain-containing protein [Limnobacter humi]|uniref:DUF1499 domain-containing protein n=1 Tax=Limnobacter humi TaxID=1778671 RepID=A0ABT1WGT8_9BURK|nr:DUF1499 domain-containing protein [Limnobacter humi]MCQ8895644.1 DUF1499 domain-containing protein [Limnobacter humi]